MKTKLLLFFFVFFSTVLNLTFAQDSKFNLKNLNNMTVDLHDSQGLLSPNIQQKIITEIKLKLMSSGVKVTSHENASATLKIVVNAIKSNFAEHRILVQFKLLEEVITKRLDSIQTSAITYSDIQLFADKDAQSGIYNKIMDNMIIAFIEKYLLSNQ